jgi:hypothetical protein
MSYLQNLGEVNPRTKKMMGSAIETCISEIQHHRDRAWAGIAESLTAGVDITNDSIGIIIESAILEAVQDAIQRPMEQLMRGLLEEPRSVLKHRQNEALWKIRKSGEGDYKSEELEEYFKEELGLGAEKEEAK